MESIITVLRKRGQQMLANLQKEKDKFGKLKSEIMGKMPKVPIDEASSSTSDLVSLKKKELNKIPLNKKANDLIDELLAMRKYLTEMNEQEEVD
jgi:hypothetical protein